IFPSGRTGMQMRQTYGVQLQQLTTRMFRKHKARTFGLVRASHAGAQSLPYVLYSDSYDHRDYVTALCNSGFSGILWCPEVRIAHSAEEWIRRFQTAVFSPLMQLNAWSDGTKPWSYPEIEGVIRDQIRLRIRLSPYLYSAFARYRRDGTPPFRAMALDASPETLPQHLSGQVDATKNPYALPKSTDTRDQYMMGDCLLVAPVFAGQTERQIILPPGNWYDFYSGAYAGNGETITVTARLETIPVFVKDGGILPLLPEDADLDQIPTRLDIRHYGRSGGQFLLHSDDGETWGYETGDYPLQELRVTPPRNGLLGDTVRHSGKADWLCENLSWRFMSP
ncbi:MAG: ABC transporter substrate-binding protein, partial [bacterium]|nr:ABC transporter substrate-binding protein [bacterium]